MLYVPKSKQVGYKSGAEAQAARDRLGKGSVKEGTTGTWYHEIPFDCPTIELGRANEDIAAIAKKYGVEPTDVLKACNNGIYLFARNYVEDGADPVKSAAKRRDEVYEEIMDWTFETGNQTYRQQIKEAKAVSVKAYNEWMDDFIASDEYKTGEWKELEEVPT